MEDKHLMLTYMNSVTDIKLPGDMSCYGVFDGHGGMLAAEYAATHLYGVLLQELEKNEAAMAGESTEEHDPMYDVITKAFVRTNEMFFESMMRQVRLEEGDFVEKYDAYVVNYVVVVVVDTACIYASTSTSSASTY